LRSFGGIRARGRRAFARPWLQRRTNRTRAGRTFRRWLQGSETGVGASAHASEDLDGQITQRIHCTLRSPESLVRVLNIRAPSTHAEINSDSAMLGPQASGGGTDSRWHDCEWMLILSDMATPVSYFSAPRGHLGKRPVMSARQAESVPYIQFLLVQIPGKAGERLNVSWIVLDNQASASSLQDGLHPCERSYRVCTTRIQCHDL